MTRLRGLLHLVMAASLWPLPALGGTAGSAAARAATSAPAHALSMTSALAPPSTTAATAAPVPTPAAAPAPAAPAASSLPTSTASSPAATSDPWSVLSRVRRSLVEAGPTGAAFTQTYIPAGFASGEKETGRLALALPDCLRWDYSNPYPKGFLLCGEVVHAWNPEDRTGRRYRVDRKNEPGLDLLLLGVDDLKSRYTATARTAPGGAVEIALSPRGKVAELADAQFAVDPATQRLVEVSYHDREGNLTRFQISDYQALPHQGQFSPPADIRWEDQR
ncbi:MAG TPA: outer membrane lipoprotein carrier protein LolA [Thermoanaerobaculia bacterium]|nr:outer membrane lipoprotein carrier protein LolA [Thermoanaerobaculia bacterium]